MFGDSPMRLISRASSDGAAMPVTEVTKIAAEIARLDARADERVAEGFFTQLQSHFDPDVVCLAPRLHLIVIEIQGPRGEARIYLHAFVQAVENARLRQTCPSNSS